MFNGDRKYQTEEFQKLLKDCSNDREAYDNFDYSFNLKELFRTEINNLDKTDSKTR